MLADMSCPLRNEKRKRKMIPSHATSRLYVQSTQAEKARPS